MGRPTGRSEDAVWRYAEDFLHTHSTLNWNAAARETAGRRIKILESMARTQDDDDDYDDNDDMSKKEEDWGGEEKQSEFIQKR